MFGPQIWGVLVGENKNPKKGNFIFESVMVYDFIE